MTLFPFLLAGSALFLLFPGADRLTAEEFTQDIVLRVNPAKKDADLDWFLDNPSLFIATQEEFIKQFAKGTYTWLDKEKTRARFNPDRTNLKLRGEESGETIVSFKDSRISGVMISLLNKGDDGYIKEIPFKAAINTAKNTLKAVAKVTETPRKKNETISKADGSVWSTKKALYMLEYLWVPEEIKDDWKWYAHGEFVRIKIVPPQVLLGAQQNTVKINISRPELVKRVKKEGSKVWLDGVPMVDQGSKGYCAVASFERVMRYFGSQVDMHDLADLANASFFGTSPAAMKDAVHKMAVRSGLRTREPIFMEGKHYNSMEKAYNREASKANLGTVDPEGLSDLYEEMDPDVFKKMRLADPGFKKFTSEVARNIDAGIPIMWALQLGMFWEERIEDSFEANRDKPKGSVDKAEDEDGDEAENQTDEVEEKKAKPAAGTPPKRPKRPPGVSGGHMRLIIGYDPKERVVFYTDSWGPGHEMKKMSIEEAWTVTMALFIVEP